MGNHAPCVLLGALFLVHCVFEFTAKGPSFFVSHGFEVECSHDCGQQQAKRLVRVQVSALLSAMV